jgi:subtilisin family serine protease
MTKHSFSFLAVLSFLTSLVTYGAMQPNDEVEVYLVLEGDSVAQVAVREQRIKAHDKGIAVSSRTRAAEIDRQQAALGSRLPSIGARETGRFQRLLNAVRVRIPKNKVEELARLPGVKRVEPVTLYTPAKAGSVPFIGAMTVWTSAYTLADGAHVDVGIIDTGIDYTHADFAGPGTTNSYAMNDHTIIEPGTFPTLRVVGGYDFAGDDYDGYNSPAPDPDPIDNAEYGHGSHVAGIAGGGGVLTNDLAYTGPYYDGLDMSRFSIGPGVAPRVRLWALKVFGRSGSTGLVPDALEWAADPNGDFDFSDRLDVVNISIGSPFGINMAEKPDIAALNTLSDLGCVCCVSAMNNGNLFYVIGSIGAAEQAITVANSIDNGRIEPSIQVVGPAAVTGWYEFAEGKFTKQLLETGPITGLVVYADPPHACEPLLNAAAISNHIALIDRGGCLFTDKVWRAQNAGAIAVILVNNTDGPLSAMSGTAPGITIPGVMISRADGDRLKTQVNSNLTIRMGAYVGLPQPELADQLYSASSRGPTSPFNQLKPDISAPGYEIVSAKAGSGSKGARSTGTSMAAPHVAGAAALLKQLYPTWTVEEIKAALMNTAAPMYDAKTNAYPESRVGAGRLQTYPAATQLLLAMSDDSTGGVSVSFGALELTNTWTGTRSVRLVNRGTLTMHLTCAVSNTVNENGVVVTIEPDNVSVPGSSEVVVTVRLTADPALFDRTADLTTTNPATGIRQMLYEASGELWFFNNSASAHLPYYATVRAASSMATTYATAGLPSSTNKAMMLIPSQGDSSHSKPLVSAFALGATSTDQHLNPILACADLLAVGAASDAAAIGNFTNGTIYFGLAVAGPWTTPLDFITALDIRVDTDRNGTTDYYLLNSSAGNLVATNADDPAYDDDIFMTILRSASSGLISSGAFLNVFSADQHDTAPFNNSVMIKPVRISALGLSSNSPNFNYRVTTYGPRVLDYPEVDSTSWISFNAAQPVIDTSYGISNTPVYSCTSTIHAVIDPVASPPEPPVLLIHHMNATTNRFQIVRFNKTTDDIDTDGIQDLWELQNFLTLTNANAGTDADSDRFIDAYEYIAGSDPKSSSSFLGMIKPPNAKPGAGNGLVIQWQSTSNRLYTLRRSTNLMEGFTHNAGTNIPAVPPINVYTDATAIGGTYMYRVEVER